MAITVVRLLRLASVAICLIVLAWFAVFAVEQTGEASGRQQAQVTETHAAVRRAHTGGAHRALDTAADELTSPFAGLVSGLQGEWASRIVRLLLALLVYGFGLGFLARVLRVRV